MQSRRRRFSWVNLSENSLRSNWHVVTAIVTAGAIVCAAVSLLSTMPPRSITMATGTSRELYGRAFRPELLPSHARRSSPSSVVASAR